MLSNFLLIFLLGFVTSQKNPHFLEDRSTIVHLFEWKWKDIAQECENFLAPHGYAGVQISPPNENLILSSRPWFERYQPLSYVLETRSGSEKELEEMSRRCNKVGVRIFADIIFNHMTGSDGIGTAGNRGEATNDNYPGVPYTREHFHDPCTITNYNDAYQVRNCELVGLRDLNQTEEYVRDKVVDFLNHLIDLGVAGFRIDAAKHMLPEDMGIIFGRLKDLNTDYGFAPGSRAFIYQEVAGFGGDAVPRELYTGIGTVLEFKYGNRLSNVFKKNDKMRFLDSWGPAWGLVDPGSDSVTFIDNHDSQRSDGSILNYKSSKPYKMAIAFMLAHPYNGTPRIISSFDFVDTNTPPPQDSNGNLISPGFNSDDTCTNGYICEHRWRQIYNMVEFRNVVRDTGINDWQTMADQQVAFCRGNKGFIVFNNEGNMDTQVHACVPPGEYCDVISGSLVDGRCTGKVIVVDQDCNTHITLYDSEEDGVIAIHQNSKRN
ncbi:alpha-amylase-like [Coccinella septempunctata]|uniref:alpha-amylase-like n=1 Tax=Coccinella septempunctata TaxID=41139 RepID=UPI001D08F751|nr:alpha-amylase-like [Coccinella septempunctata]